MTIQHGTVAKWLNHKGIGFITPEGQDSVEGEDLLVHFSEIQQEGTKFKSLKEGAEVSYTLQKDAKNPEKFVATKVHAKGGGDALEALQRCYNCQEFANHKAADCPSDRKERAPRRGKGKGKGKGKGSKACHTCGSTDHLKRDCPEEEEEE